MDCTFEGLQKSKIKRNSFRYLVLTLHTFVNVSNLLWTFSKISWILNQVVTKVKKPFLCIKSRKNGM